MPPPTRTLDPVLYHELAEPRPAEQLRADLTAFMDDVLAARIKHRIPNIIVTALGFTDDPAPNNVLMVIAPFGDASLSVQIARATLEQMKADREQLEASRALASASITAREVLIIGEKTLAKMPDDIRPMFEAHRVKAITAVLPATMKEILDKARWRIGEEPDQYGTAEDGALVVLGALGAVEKDGVWVIPAVATAVPHNPPTLSPVDRARFLGILHGLVAEAGQSTLSTPHVVKAMAREVLRGLGVGAGIAWNEQRQVSAEKTAREILRWLDGENDIRLNRGNPDPLSAEELTLCPIDDSMALAEVLVKVTPTEIA